jgi:hypothetical protein
MDIPRCHSCGHPLYRGHLGTKLDGSDSREFCADCYQKGAWTEPGLTLEALVQRESRRLVHEKIVTDDKALEQARRLLSHLKRWTSMS